MEAACTATSRPATNFKSKSKRLSRRNSKVTVSRRFLMLVLMMMLFIVTEHNHQHVLGDEADTATARFWNEDPVHSTEDSVSDEVLAASRPEREPVEVMDVLTRFARAFRLEQKLPGPTAMRGSAEEVEHKRSTEEQPGAAPKPPTGQQQERQNRGVRRSPCLGPNTTGDSSILSLQASKNVYDANNKPSAENRTHLALFRPLLVTSPMNITIHDHTYHTLFLLKIFVTKSTNSSHLTHRTVHVDTFDIHHDDGQTWWLQPAVQLVPTPAVCNAGNHAFSAMAARVLGGRNEIYLFGFGTHRSCAILQRWKVGDENFTLVNTSNGSHVPHTYHSMVSVEDVPEGNAYLVSFGGGECILTPVGDVNCSKFSNELWFLKLPGDEEHKKTQDDSESSWYKVSPVNVAPCGRLSPVLMSPGDGTLLMYGGVAESKMAPGVPNVSLCDLWEYNITHRSWTWLYNLTSDQCDHGIAELSSPMRPLAAYDAEKQVVFIMVLQLITQIEIPNVERVTIVTYFRKRAKRGLFQHRHHKSLELRYPAILKREIITWNTRLILCNTDNYVTVDILLKENKTGSLSEASMVYRFLSPKGNDIFRFAGNYGCYSPPPIKTFLYGRLPGCVGDRHRADLILGGFCVSSDFALAANWYVTPVWFYLPEFNGYLMKTIYHLKPPKFNQRIGYTVVEVVDRKVANSSKAVMFGGVSAAGFKITSDISCFDLRDHFWTTGVLESNHNIPADHHGHPVAGHVAFRVPVVNGKSPRFLVYGGVVDHPRYLGRTTSNISVFEFSNLTACKGRWLSVNVGSGSSKLPEVAFHSVTLHNDNYYIYGGLRTDKRTNRCGEFFRLNLNLESLNMSATCSPIHVAPSQSCFSLPYYPMFHSMTVFTNHSFLLLGGVAGLGIQTQPVSVALLLSFNTTPGSHTAAVPFFRHQPLLFHHVFGEMVYGGYSQGSKPKSHFAELSLRAIHRVQLHACPPGYGKPDYSPNSECERCNGTKYSPSTAAHCRDCPQNQIFNPDDYQRCKAVDPCLNLQCHHGTCKQDNETHNLLCICQNGYLSYDNCNLPLIAMGSCALSLLFVSVLFVTVYIYVKARKEHRIKDKIITEKTLTIATCERSLWELAASRHIRMSELVLLRRLNITSPDSKCQFRLATLGDAQVVVKKMKRGYGLTSESDKARFHAEAEVMWRIRHENVVRFIGAGIDTGTQCPFIVLEYMKLGSFEAFLRNTDNEVTVDDAIRFSWNAARGMKYLHGLNPVRIHRNLKASNLMLTSDYVLKVADFSMASLVPRYTSDKTRDPLTAPAADSDNQTAGNLFQRRCGRRSGEARPLLERGAERRQAYEVECCQKSWRWRAPETLNDGIFNISTDIYRYY